MKKYSLKGYISGIMSSVSYGTNPLFALPMYMEGFGVNSVLFYRYFFATLIYWFWVKFKRKTSLKINFKEGLALFVLALVFSFSSLTLFAAFEYMDAGLACTILFIYPIVVALISFFIFKENLPKIIWLSILMTTVGIALLYKGNPDENLNIKGMVLILISAFMEAFYMLGVKHIKIIKNMKYDKVAFYIMLFGLTVYIWNLKFCTELQMLNSPKMVFCGIMLGILPTIVSIESINIAVKLIGATKTSFLGALEPLTALFIGILLFNEEYTKKIAIGVVLIILGVMFVITSKRKVYGK